MHMTLLKTIWLLEDTIKTLGSAKNGVLTVLWKYAKGKKRSQFSQAIEKHWKADAS